ncbi:MAG TPA: type IV pilus biogenesis/stability protein PilW [Nevskiaceae bacterium]|nr:type IV pilus biogenesis/stability protein PilW [Nevskiaceae bacterium]
MRALALLLLSLALGGCVTTVETETGRSRKGADLAEAARLNTQLGMDYMRKGELDLAQEKLSKALEQDPDLALAHSTIAFLHSKRGDQKKAEQHYRKALSLDSSNPSARNNFGVFLCGLNQFDEAEKLFMQAAQDRAFKTPEAAWTNAGVCARKLPDVARAEQYFRRALELNPEYPDALAQLARISLERQDALRARGFLQRYERVARETPETLWMAHTAEAALGDAEAAERYRRRLIQQFPESAESQRLQPATAPASP